MATDELKVYLDHLIPRENLRYQRSREQVPSTQPGSQQLRLSDLFQDHTSAQARSLRKPDFQRATWAWTPEDCVSLLESIINEQVVPSIIMWSSPENGFDYVLDGGHRISVIMAWLNDDWGDKLSTDEYIDEAQERSIKQAAKEVRNLVKVRVGSINDYKSADEEFNHAVMQDKAPRLVLNSVTFGRGLFYQHLLKGHIYFHILWVSGNYEKAEISFLKINKSGRQLYDWETTIIENRHSSFVRLLMSISSLNSSKHYWHTKEITEAADDLLPEKIANILTGVHKIHEMLFLPAYETPIKKIQQPLLVPSDIPARPYWLAELLTVIEGGKGQKTETRKLIERDKNAPPQEIINNGLKLVGDALEGLSHLIGPSPKSLALVPVLYFYTDSGRYVRSLLYGFLYWLLTGTENDILNRKRVFSIHRAAFEQILLENKEDVVTGITRKTASGPGVTSQTAQYYQGLLEILVKHKDSLQSDGFVADYAALAKRLTNRATKVRVSAGTSRIFSKTQKSALVLENFFYNPNHCGICNGILDPAADLQHDHIVEYAKGGKTSRDNQRLVHPFCNNPSNREIIENGRAGKETVILPRFVDPDLATEPQQLKLAFFDDPDFR